MLFFTLVQLLAVFHGADEWRPYDMAEGQWIFGGIERENRKAALLCRGRQDSDSLPWKTGLRNRYLSKLNNG
jgi:hypothetical protein